MHSFQYISCYGLFTHAITSFHAQYHFNTSHVTVYLHIIIGLNHKMIFQYISCYGLSVREPLTTIVSKKFQYISCYGLSCTWLLEIVRRSTFQYISCYGLSSCDELQFVRGFLISIHLMLRFIFKVPAS